MILVRDWSQDDIARLRELAADVSLSAADIGRHFGVSKNAIIGKLNRLGVQRPEGISRGGAHRPAPPKPAPLPAPRLMPADMRPPTDCAYPIGDPKRIGFHYCNAQPWPGRSYCVVHMRVCYEVASGGERRPWRET